MSQVSYTQWGLWCKVDDGYLHCSRMTLSALALITFISCACIGKYMADLKKEVINLRNRPIQVVHQSQNNFLDTGVNACITTAITIGGSYILNALIFGWSAPVSLPVVATVSAGNLMYKFFNR